MKKMLLVMVLTLTGCACQRDLQKAYQIIDLQKHALDYWQLKHAQEAQKVQAYEHDRDWQKRIIQGPVK